MREVDWMEHIWFGDDVIAQTARAALLPLAAAYGAVIGMREAMYGVGLLRRETPALPAISIGNLTVGGTGKTPVAAWVASQVARRGARPAIILRGYGEDEPLVHRILNPSVPVIVAKDRVQGIAQAGRRGATLAVLDDAFQHRRVVRAVDILLVSADRWPSAAHLLPAGPWREPLRASRRATVIVVTRKAVAPSSADAVHERFSLIAPRVPRATLHLASAELTDLATGRRVALSTVAGRPVRLLTAIADPVALTHQLEASGARVHAELHPDHHPFSDEEVARFAASIPSDGLAICTLKDAVKLVDRWPREAPTLWYVSQHVIVERGAECVERVLDQIARAHAPVAP